MKHSRIGDLKKIIFHPFIKASATFCICPQCGHSVKHHPGVPCRSLICHDCKVPMIREVASGNNNLVTNCDPLKPLIEQGKNKLLIPRVVIMKCDGCGICIDICPKEAIVMEDGKAFINYDQCRNCKVCVAKCPANAIILE